MLHYILLFSVEIVLYVLVALAFIKSVDLPPKSVKKIQIKLLFKFLFAFLSFEFEQTYIAHIVGAWVIRNSAKAAREGFWQNSQSFRVFVYTCKNVDTQTAIYLIITGN